MLIREYAEKYSDYIIEMRRKFHRCPELCFQEKRTCEMICKELQAMELMPQVLCGTGVVVDIGDRARSGRTVAIRADIDALMVKEETGADYASENEGYMHACGHDAHIAMNLGCAKILRDIQDQLNGSVRLIFQPAEEFARGASAMIEAGALKDVDTIYGTHVWGDIPAGKFSAEAGARMASADFFTITVRGKATHGALPHNGVDPITAAAAIIQNLQVVFHREIIATEPAVISLCQIHGGDADNAIPDKVTIGGTTRTYSREVRESFPIIMERVIHDTAAAFRAEVELDYRWGSSAVINDAECSERAIRAITANYGEQAVTRFEHVMSGEDYSEYQEVVPGVFVFLGIRNEETGAAWPNHSSHFAVDEHVLARGAAAAVQYAVDFLQG
ncbi:MAG: amidohydrolase [Lachnospiraceae bacterium]|nr:amidohydrolase [Lachnospiraceae bacterium]